MNKTDLLIDELIKLNFKLGKMNKYLEKIAERICATNESGRDLFSGLDFVSIDKKGVEEK